MNHEIKQSDWRTVANCLKSQNYIDCKISTSFHSD